MDANRTLRNDAAVGVVYPSARHSKGSSLAFFFDQSSSITDIEHLPITLSLVSEDDVRDRADVLAEPPKHLYDTKIHPTIGHYRIEDLSKLNSLDQAGVLNPSIPVEGFIEFTRRGYQAYPDHAVSY